MISGVWVVAVALVVFIVIWGVVLVGSRPFGPQ